MRILARASWLAVAVLLALTVGLRAGVAETRFALVIGNSDYRAGALSTPANDAGLVADALTAAGFTVTGAANLDQATLRETIREFIDQVSAAGPDAVALVYFSGYGLQLNGDNYFVPVDANIQRDADVPLQALRISDFTQPLAGLAARVKIVILDAARENPFARSGEPLASGLALIDPVPGIAFTFNAAPGTVGPNEPGPYGAYATALTEMIAAGGLSLDDIFARVRLRVSELTQGAEIPWYVSGINGAFFMTEREAGAPPPPDVRPFAAIRDRPLRDFTNVADAYAAVLEVDTIEAYGQFLTVYPNSPYSRRVAAMLAVRREEIIWRRCVAADTPQAYWSYLRRYPRGPHSWDARRRLAILRAALEPPASFGFIDFGVPPPPPDELEYVDRPILIFAGPGWAPPPQPPIIFLPPQPREFVRLPPPPPPRERFGLPVPRSNVVPIFVKPPPVVRLPPRPPGVPPNGQTRGPISLPVAVKQPPHSASPPGPPPPSPPPPPPHAAPPPPRVAPPPPHPAPPPPHPAAPLPPHPASPPPPHPASPPPPHPASPPQRPAPPPPHPATPPPHPATPPPPHPAAPPPPHPASPPQRPAPPPPHPAAPACPPDKHSTPQGCK
jgi:uncharacterized caspase-like protein